jgi:hypothetical protein
MHGQIVGSISGFWLSSYDSGAKRQHYSWKKLFLEVTMELLVKGEISTGRNFIRNLYSFELSQF